MTSSSVRAENRPVRAFALHTPRWQRFQNKMGKASGTSDSNKKQKMESSSSKSLKSSETEVIAYQRQYSHVYSYRLAALKDGCWKRLKQLNSKAARRDDGNLIDVNRILELQEDKLSNVVGTIIVESMNGNSDENYYNDNVDGEDRLLHPNATCRSGDQLFLEDESGRVALQFVNRADGDDDNHAGSLSYQYCTGVVVGVQGSVDAKGVLNAKRIVTPALPPPTSSRAFPDEDDDDSSTSTAHLLLVSSLLCGDPEVSSLPREMLVSYLQGHFNDSASKVAHVIVAGSGPGNVDPVMGLREFDMLGLQVTRAAGIPMDIMPSATDPTTRNWPQRPLHSSLLPHTLRSTNDIGSGDVPMARLTPNPYECSIGDQLVLGTDGLNVRDLQKYVLKTPCSNEVQNSNNHSDHTNSSSPLPLSELDALEQTLRWAHICPTGPNSPDIGMVPSGDPMVMSRRAPNIYFCGNCEEGFASKLFFHNAENGHDTSMTGKAGEPKTRLICVPKFSETGEAVLVNLKTLEVELLQFAADIVDDGSN
mmetsp:Transcript_15002/g.34773  ORF Transcript_15002/g.34773 Transcript_15002/m.34773 type:complete len:535 (-) Transcript_15002:162-1766(-)|eukprot:CAMPEP_0197193084 /NCGR_PEP_ID=MMETSP1423-20130617/26390_1 /TAXON_ID=476441 /ORGANISM="Pseudo-nitzschia heimii, Strain UNC1101" /LENGTH=534 /DNA_ID=CAMNT_0042646149 /DNA_START=52 /DNA_END=1656 /DNA_ORIENTATION=+